MGDLFSEGTLGVKAQDQESNSWDLSEDKLYPTVLFMFTQLWWVSSSKSLIPSFFFLWKLPVAVSGNVLHATFKYPLGR